MTEAKTYNLTKKEFEAAKLIVAECVSGMGGKRPSDLANDEYTWAYPQTLIDAGYSKYQAAGLFGGLMGKGFIYSQRTKRNGKLVTEWVVQTSAWQWMDTQWDEKAE